MVAHLEALEITSKVNMTLVPNTLPGVEKLLINDESEVDKWYALTVWHRWYIVEWQRVFPASFARPTVGEGGLAKRNLLWTTALVDRRPARCRSPYIYVHTSETRNTDT